MTMHTTGKLIGFGVLAFVGWAGWHIGRNISSDALTLALGMVFGSMAGIPAALIVVTAGRKEKPAEPARFVASQKALAALSVKPQAYVVIDNAAKLTASQSRIEVAR